MGHSENPYGASNDPTNFLLRSLRQCSLPTDSGHAVVTSGVLNHNHSATKPGSVHNLTSTWIDLETTLTYSSNGCQVRIVQVTRSIAASSVPNDKLNDNLDSTTISHASTVISLRTSDRAALIGSMRFCCDHSSINVSVLTKEVRKS